MNFIREHFDRILVFLVFLVTVGIYWLKPTPFSEQLVVTVTGGLLGLLMGRRGTGTTTGATNISTDTIETGDIIMPENADKKLQEGK